MEIIKEVELKFKVQNWGSTPRFVAEINNEEIASEESLEYLIKTIDDISQDIFDYHSNIYGGE